MYMIFTNNPAVVEQLKAQPDGRYDIKWIGSPAMDVLVAARAAVHQGGTLVSNPLTGVRMNNNPFQPQNLRARNEKQTIGNISKSDKPIAFNPYVSVLVASPQGAVDFQSVKRIDEALAVYRKNARMRFIAHSDDMVKRYQGMDVEHLLSVLTALI